MTIAAKSALVADRMGRTADGGVDGTRMTPLRILFVDDEPDLRTVVGFSLALDPQITTRTCASGHEALGVAAEWLPDLILCDVMMPVMDGPATLARLRENPQTAQIPLVFMTARARAHECEYLLSLGARGVIAKPFDPASLAQAVRGYLPGHGNAADGGGIGENAPDDKAKESVEFADRLRRDRASLLKWQAMLRSGAAPASALRDLESCAHKLAGAAGLFGFDRVSRSASALEEAIVDRPPGGDIPDDIEGALDALVGWIEESIPGECRHDAVADLASAHR